MTLKLADGVPGVTGSGTYDPFPGVSGTSLVPHRTLDLFLSTRGGYDSQCEPKSMQSFI